MGIIIWLVGNYYTQCTVQLVGLCEQQTCMVLLVERWEDEKSWMASSSSLSPGSEMLMQKFYWFDKTKSKRWVVGLAAGFMWLVKTSKKNKTKKNIADTSDQSTSEVKYNKN